MQDEEMDGRSLEALWRFGLVAPALPERPWGERTAMIRSLADKPIPWVDGRIKQVSEATLWRWLAQARRDHLAGLYRRPRSDKGRRTAIPEPVFAAAMELRRSYPSMSSRQIVETLELEGLIQPGQVAVSTLRRWLREAGLPRRSSRGSSGQRSYVRWECTAPNELWLADATTGLFLPHPERPGRWRATQLLLMEDAFSRRAVGGGFYWNQQLPALDDCFFRATLNWGIPGEVYLDHGHIFVSRHFQRVCAELGVMVHFASSPEAKGKIERLIQTVKNGFYEQARALIEAGQITDLVTLNERFWLWMDEVYHQRVHEETGATPAARMPEPVRPVRDPLAHEQIFLWRVTRTVRRAGCTVELLGNVYEVDRALAGQRVEVRFNPYKLDTVAIWHEGRFRQTATLRQLVRRRHPRVSPLPESRPPAPTTTLNQLAALQRRAEAQREGRAGLSLAAPPALRPTRLADVLAAALGRPLDERELRAVHDHWRHYGPFDPQTFVPYLEQFIAQKGRGHHIEVYLDIFRPEVGW